MRWRGAHYAGESICARATRSKAFTDPDAAHGAWDKHANGMTLMDMRGCPWLVEEREAGVLGAASEPVTLPINLGLTACVIGRTTLAELRATSCEQTAPDSGLLLTGHRQ